VLTTVIDPEPLGHFQKFKTFITDERTVRYAGRTIVVIVAASLIYYAFRNRKKITSECFKCYQTVKAKFKSEPKPPKDITIPEKVTTVNLNINHPLNFNVKVIKDGESSEEGKSSESTSTVAKVESVTSTTRESPSFKLTDPIGEKPKEDKGWSLFS